MKNIWLLILCTALSVCSVKAQCPVPVNDSIFSTPAYCQGTGSITVYSVTGGGTGNTYQYELRYDSVANTTVAKPYQDNNVFVNVLRGRYKVNIRTVCPSIGISAPFTSASIVVDGSSTPLSISSTTINNISTCGNGRFTTTANGGNTYSPYQYALVPSQGAAEPVTTYVRPKQSSNIFAGLPAGTYYVRVYDSCGTFATAPVVIDTAAEAVTLSSDRNGYSFYGCDSLQFRMNVAMNYKKVSGNQDPAERGWIRYNGVTDTIPNIFFNYTASTGITNSSAILKILKPITYPAVVTYGFKTPCGNIYTKTDTIKAPVLKLDLISTSLSCTQRIYTIRTKDSLSIGWTYYNTRLSKDNGVTWSNLNKNYYYTDTFVVGQTYQLVLASGCDTDQLTVTTVVPALNLAMNEFNAYSCNGKSGFSMSIFGGQFSGNVDSIKLNVISQPAGANLPDSFYYVQETGTSGSTGGFRLTYNLPPGTYTIKGTDQCGGTTTQSVVINPTVLSYTITPKLSCTPVQSGFTLNVAQTNYQPYYGYSPVRAQVINTSTGTVDSFTSESAFRPTTINVTGLVNGTYTIKVYRVLPVVLPAQTCTIDTVYVNTSNQPLSLSQSYFTAACANNSATVAAIAQGGGGNYSYSLYKKNGSGTYVLDAGPQAGNIFNNLSSGSEYQVKVTDTCGNGTQYATSFDGSVPSIFLSTSTAPCPGNPVTFSVPVYPGATYGWTKNSATIAAATGNSYTVNAVPVSTVDTYKAVVSLGSCIIYSNAYILNPANCGQPLPVTLVRFGGRYLESGHAQLNWQVANPEIATYFVVEYSLDGKIFNACGSLPANASSDYVYQDIDRNQARLYYRLKLVSKDGHNTYSGIVTLQKNRQTGGSIKIYPTMVTESIHISYTTLSTGTLPWTLSDMEGRIIQSGLFQVGAGTGELNINGLSNLANGTYILKINNNTDLKYQGKIVVMH